VKQKAREFSKTWCQLMGKRRLPARPASLVLVLCCILPHCYSLCVRQAVSFEGSEAFGLISSSRGSHRGWDLSPRPSSAGGQGGGEGGLTLGMAAATRCRPAGRSHRSGFEGLELVTE